MSGRTFLQSEIGVGGYFGLSRLAMTDPTREIASCEIHLNMSLKTNMPCPIEPGLFLSF